MKPEWEPSTPDLLQYRRDGFLIVRSLLSGNEVHLYRQAIDLLINMEFQQQEQLQAGYNQIFLQVQNIWQRDETFQTLVCNPYLARIAAMLGEMTCVRVFLDQVLYKQPGAKPTRSHQDAPYLSFNDSRSLNCWIALDDTTVQNGAIEYFVGSHHIGATRLVHLDQADNLMEDFPVLKGFTVKRVEAQAGDVVFHNCQVVHCASGNSTDSPRRAYSIQYMPDGVCYNGWLHPFMKSYCPEEGQVLDFDCFPIVYPSKGC